MNVFTLSTTPHLHVCTFYSICKCNLIFCGKCIFELKLEPHDILTAPVYHCMNTDCTFAICISVCCSLGCIVPRSCPTPTWCSWSLMPRQHVCHVTPGHYDRLNNPVSFHSTRKKKSTAELHFAFSLQPSIHHPHYSGALNSRYKDTHLWTLQ